MSFAVLEEGAPTAEVQAIGGQSICPASSRFQPKARPHSWRAGEQIA